jgi:glycosyltransferase involved in cell wall biosynthesis/O-antigen/teichoic acid export membrane protein
VRGVSFVFLPYFLSRLALSEFGIWDFYQMFFSMGTMLLTSCTATGMIRFFLFYKDDLEKQQQAIGNALLITLGAATLFPFLAFAFFYAVHPDVLNSNYLVITIFNISFFALFSMVLAFMRMKEKLMWYTLLFCGQNLLATGLTVWLVSHEYGIQSFFYASTTSFLIFVPLFFGLLRRYHIFSAAILKEQLVYSVPLLVYGFIYTGFYSIDRFFIKYDSGFEALGMYGILGRFGSLFQFFSIALMDAWPVVLFNAQKEEKGDHLIAKLISYFLLVLTTGGLAAVVVSSWAMHRFFVEEYWGIATLLALYFLPLVLLEIARVLQVGFALSTKTYLSPLLALFGLGMQALALWVGKEYGLPGIMLANAAAFTVYAVASLIMSKAAYKSGVIHTSRVLKIMAFFAGYSIVLHGLLMINSVPLQLLFLLSWPIVLWRFGGVEHDEKNWLYNKIGSWGSSFIGNDQQTGTKNILYLRTDINFQEIMAGGSVAHTLGVINGFKELGYTVLCASSSMQSTLQSLDLPYFQELKVYPVFAFLRWKLGHLRWRLDCLFANIFFTIQLLGTLKRESVQFIYQRYSLLNCVGLIASKLKGVPLILEYNGSEVWVFKAWSEHRWFTLPRISQAVENLNIRHATFIVVVSQQIKDDLVHKGIEATKILVNPNGVDPSFYDPEKLQDLRIETRNLLGLTDKFVFGFIGTFSYWHGIEVLAHIIPALVKKHGHVHFLLIGDGPLKKFITDAITQARVEDAVTFTGLVQQRHARSFLAACDAFLCPTQPNADGTPFFGSPTKLFEYMSMGKPIIASDLGQLSELLSPSARVEDESLITHHCGFLVKPEDFDSFYTAAEKIIQLDSTHKQKMGSNARAKVIASYSWRRHVENIQAFVSL